MNQLPKWLLANPFPAIHDFESLTVLEQTARLYGAMEALIKEYNIFEETVRDQLSSFKEEERTARENFETDITKVLRQFICELKVSASAVATVADIELPAAKWEGDGHLHSQVVQIGGITENSQINLTPSVEQLAVFYEKDITFITENDNCVVTVYVIGQKPESDYVIPASIMEVIV